MPSTKIFLLISSKYNIFKNVLYKLNFFLKNYLNNIIFEMEFLIIFENI